MSDPAAYAGIDWSLYGTVINCGAYTAVDRAETPEGRVACWTANATGPSLLARTCAAHGLALVHISTDYVFDGICNTHDESESLAPLGVYGQSKAAGDLAVQGCPAHYILRSSWVVGRGHNFVRTMWGLAARAADPSDALNHVDVVDDQLGRLTFADQMAEAIFHLLGYREHDVEPSSPASFGTYDVTGSGSTRSWADIARRVFERAQGNGDAVVPVSTEAYYSEASGPVAPRPRHSTLDLSKLEATGFTPRDWEAELEEYLDELAEEV